MVSSSDHGANLPAIKKFLAQTTLSFQGIPGNDPGRTIFIREKNGSTYIPSKDLSADFFARCPSNYLTETGKLQINLRKNQSVPAFIIEDDSPPSITKVIYRPSGIHWVLTCEPVVSWPDIPESKMFVKLSFEVRLDADRVILPGAASNPNYQPITSAALGSEQNGFGTRYFKDYSSGNPDKSSIQRWNPLRERLVIDDTNDSSGKALSTTEYGRWIKEGLKIATADLRMKFPPLGNKIALTSEQPRLQPDIAFSLGDAMGAAGIAMTLLDDKNGEIRQARIGIGGESNLSGRIKMIDGFYKLGMLDDPKRSYRESFLTMVIHELGHTLGLRHNFAGYGLNNNWGNDLQAVMSYAMIGFPIEFVSEKVEWKPHDILSLKILYADLAGNSSGNRGALISEILKYPLSTDEMLSNNPFGDFAGHFTRALKYLETMNHPKMVRFRETNPDWKAKIKSVYKDAYDADLE